MAILSGVAGVALLTGGVVYTSNASAGWSKTSASLIDMFRSNKAVKDIGEVKFKVNGQPVSKRYFETEKNYYVYLNKTNGNPIPSDQEIIKIITRKEALYQKALSMGLEATDQEVDEFLEKQKAAFYSNDPNVSGNQEIRAALEASGQSEEDFWKDCRAEYKKILTTGKLTDQLFAEIGPVKESVDNVGKITELLNKKYDEIAAQAKIEMVNE